MSQRESNIQQACVKWFALQYPQYKGCLIAIPNGGSRHPLEGARLKREGVVAGVADLQLLVAKKGFYSLFIEMKTPSKASRQQPTQKAWQAVVEAQGYGYIVCRGLEEFMDIINNYLRD